MVYTLLIYQKVDYLTNGINFIYKNKIADN